MESMQLRMWLDCPLEAKSMFFVAVFVANNPGQMSGVRLVGVGYRSRCDCPKACCTCSLVSVVVLKAPNF